MRQRIHADTDQYRPGLSHQPPESSARHCEPTGFTDEAVRHTARELERLAWKSKLTRRGAIRLFGRGLPSPGPRDRLAPGHLGAQVKALKENGRLELVSIGHWSARFAEGAQRLDLFRQGHLSRFNSPR
ncbi:hypothetical protein F2981_18180 (plasmid) [Sinorhizobium meliloti]|nr:hypothetical protein [Sinorhizobium meliloti]